MSTHRQEHPHKSRVLFFLKGTDLIPVFRKLSTLAILPFLSFLCFNLGTIVLFVCVILGLYYKINDQDTELYLTSNVWMIVIYDKGNSHCQICHFCIVGCYE